MKWVFIAIAILIIIAVMLWCCLKVGGDADEYEERQGKDGFYIPDNDSIYHRYDSEHL